MLSLRSFNILTTAKKTDIDSILLVLCIIALSATAQTKPFITMGATIGKSTPAGSSLDVAINKALDPASVFIIGFHPSTYTASSSNTESQTFNLSISTEYSVSDLLVDGLSTGFGTSGTVTNGQKNNNHYQDSYGWRLFASNSISIGNGCTIGNTVGVSKGQKKPKGASKIDTLSIGQATLGVACRVS
jgi:hypothetical protein